MNTYTKTTDGQLEIKETKEEVQVYSLEELVIDRDYISSQMGFYQDKIDALDALIAKAREVGVVEKDMTETEVSKTK